MPIRALKVFRDCAFNWHIEFLNRGTIEGEMPDEWKDSTIVPILKQSGNTSECSNHREIKLTNQSHT